MKNEQKYPNLASQQQLRPWQLALKQAENTKNSVFLTEISRISVTTTDLDGEISSPSFRVPDHPKTGPKRRSKTEVPREEVKSGPKSRSQGLRVYYYM